MNKSNFFKQLIDLKNYYISKEELNKRQKNIEIELTKVSTHKEILLNQCDEYRKILEKIKQKRKSVNICTTLFYLFLIYIFIISINNIFSNIIYLCLGSIPVIMTSFIIAVHKDIKFLNRYKSSIYKRKIKDSEKKLDNINTKINSLKKDLDTLNIEALETSKEIEKIYNFLSNDDIKINEEVDKPKTFKKTLNE